MPLIQGISQSCGETQQHVETRPAPRSQPAGSQAERYNQDSFAQRKEKEIAWLQPVRGHCGQPVPAFWVGRRIAATMASSTDYRDHRAHQPVTLPQRSVDIAGHRRTEQSECTNSGGRPTTVQRCAL
ncbi:hypothetical protein JK2ML_2468 [Mycobacterium leprae Kyoto-2]|uniref:Uncharacterized protein n=3 Tax=Mycobacterium leprae TaxID=1769 RepID=Q9CB35_MYCLE|nr:hypothetical protein DIJ64_13560 [Mycobacterium leprae]OAR19733.1 hypothetical protein A8144_13515 [Mycobacterium leprae 3125609]OAX70179.1 hypothetical protein A3216_13510 [Mycobacterium leprae 7935681]CAR72567.1 hypothetical protein MLBr02468 [Mycobacterium leprae Br4923]BBC17763.1 hypothetical protein JK2ML_2468 [Mycobacterium leprae Kyoto-2]